MKATALKEILQKAIDKRIIECKEINSLRCPATGHNLVHGRCSQESNSNLKDVCHRGDKMDCIHRLDILYSDRSYPDVLKVKYRIASGVKEGFIDDRNEQLLIVLKKIL